MGKKKKATTKPWEGSYEITHDEFMSKAFRRAKLLNRS